MNKRPSVKAAFPLTTTLLIFLWAFLLPASTQAQATWDTNGTDAYRLSGSIGIGAAPTTKLTITDGTSPYAAAATDLLQLKRGTANGTANGGVSLALANGTNGFRIKYGGTSDRLSFLDGGNGEVLSLLNGGNVGIGTDSPGTKLDVFGAVRGFNFFGPQQTAFTVGTDSSVASGAAIQLFGITGTGTMTNQIRFLTGSSSLQYRMIIDGAGNVGVGTASPVTRFHVVGDISLDVAGNKYYFVKNGASPDTNWSLGLAGSVGGSLVSDGGVVQTIYGGGGSYGYMVKNTNGTPLLEVLGSTGTTYIAGSVGIGVAPDANYKLDVAGSVKVSGNIAAKYQDVAEWVQSRQQLTAGTVVILDPEKSNQVIASTESYDTRVAGVISEQPGVLLGEGGEGKVKVATTGRVKVKVDATRGAIKIGDLLVTSDKAGVAMKSEPIIMQGRRIHAPGTIIGKALEPLEGGVGEIMVLLSLQ